MDGAQFSTKPIDSVQRNWACDADQHWTCCRWCRCNADGCCGQCRCSVPAAESGQLRQRFHLFRGSLCSPWRRWQRLSAAKARFLCQWFHLLRGHVRPPRWWCIQCLPPEKSWFLRHRLYLLGWDVRTEALTLANSPLFRVVRSRSASSRQDWSARN